MNNTLILTAIFLLYLFVQALIINGIYISAAGKTDILPDGTEADSEMILYPLYKFLNQFTLKRVYYTMTYIKPRVSNFPTIVGGVIQWNTEGPAFPVIPTSPNPNIDALTAWAQAYLSAKVEYDPTTHIVRFYQEVQEYRFSKYIRKPIITCVICMASFWCILLFLIPVIFVFGFNYKIIPIWIADTFAVAYLNYFIFKSRS